MIYLTQNILATVIILENIGTASSFVRFRPYSILPKGKIGRGKDFFEEAFGRSVDEFYKILWMPETFIIYRRIYDAELRGRMAERYTTKTPHDCDLANEWWSKFSALSEEKEMQ